MRAKTVCFSERVGLAPEIMKARWKERRLGTLTGLLAKGDPVLKGKLLEATIALEKRDRDIPKEAIEHIDALRFPQILVRLVCFDDRRRGETFGRWQNLAEIDRVLAELTSTGEIDTDVMTKLLLIADRKRAEAIADYIMGLIALRSEILVVPITEMDRHFAPRELASILGTALDKGTSDVKEAVRKVCEDAGFDRYLKRFNWRKESSFYGIVANGIATIIAASVSLSGFMNIEGVFGKVVGVMTGMIALLTGLKTVNNTVNFRKEGHDYQFLGNVGTEDGSGVLPGNARVEPRP